MACYKYLLSIEDHFYTKEHPFNVKVVRVTHICKEISELEDKLEQLRLELDEAVKDMRIRRRIRRAGRS